MCCEVKQVIRILCKEVLWESNTDKTYHFNVFQCFFKKWVPGCMYKVSIFVPQWLLIYVYSSSNITRPVIISNALAVSRLVSIANPRKTTYVAISVPNRVLWIASLCVSIFDCKPYRSLNNGFGELSKFSGRASVSSYCSWSSCIVVGLIPAVRASIFSRKEPAGGCFCLYAMKEIEKKVNQ